MSCIYKETEHRFRKRPPHCSTCICQEETTFLNKTKISSPRIKALRRSSPPSRFSPRERKMCHRCCHSSKEDWEPNEDWEPRRRNHHPYEERCLGISPPVRVNRKMHRDHKFSILENWFKKFDFDGNGLLDVYEMKSLLNYLGVQAQNSYVKELIESADRDADGMLSFSDFLYMWHQAAEEDMELYDVIREHALHPDILPHREFRPPKQQADRNVQIKELTRKYEIQRDCSCGNVARKVRKSPKGRKVEMQTKISRSPLHCGDTLPILSCHR